jgi:hypothetical protein
VDKQPASAGRFTRGHAVGEQSAAATAASTGNPPATRRAFTAGRSAATWGTPTTLEPYPGAPRGFTTRQCWGTGHQR